MLASTTVKAEGLRARLLSRDTYFQACLLVARSRRRAYGLDSSRLHDCSRLRARLLSSTRLLSSILWARLLSSLHWRTGTTALVYSMCTTALVYSMCTTALVYSMCSTALVYSMCTTALVYVHDCSLCTQLLSSMGSTATLSSTLCLAIFGDVFVPRRKT
jgi:hypothetical protein